MCVADVSEGSVERDLQLQHEGTAQEHVGAEGGISALQATGDH